MALKVRLIEAVHRRTFICCRSIQISASSAARDRIRSTTIQTMSLTRSLITQQHRPILDQLLVSLGLRQGQEIAVQSGVMAPSHWLSLSLPAILPGHAGMKSSTVDRSGERG